MALLFGLFFLFLIMGMPVAFCMMCSAVLYCTVFGESINMVLTRTIAGPSSFTLMALAFFILAGNIMNNGGVTDQIFGFCKKAVGWIPGGLGHANVLASVIFAGMSGAAVADAGGLGAIEVKAMRDDGYDDEFAVAVTGASSIIGPIIPPSIPVVVYAVAASVSVGKLLIGGLIPGLVLALCMMVYIYFVSKKRHYPKHEFEGFPALGRSFVKSLPALLTPCIILGGILTGVCTPTEASAVAVGYALILSLVSRNLSLKDLPRILDETILTTMSVLFIVWLHHHHCPAAAEDDCPVLQLHHQPLHSPAADQPVPAGCWHADGVLVRPDAADPHPGPHRHELRHRPDSLRHRDDFESDDRYADPARWHGAVCSEPYDANTI